MKTPVKIVFLGLAVTCGLFTSTAFANEGKKQHGIPAYKFIIHDKYADKLSGEQKLDLRRYVQYEEREPCQNYREPPVGFKRKKCDVFYPVKKKAQMMESRTVHERMDIRNVLMSYEVKFGFDKSNIESTAEATLDQAARDIGKYNPREVVVSGHADKAGPSDYNVRLSSRRAEAVSEALTSRGVPNRILDKKALGEGDPAVETDDGVPLRENRRVVIEFLE